MKVSYLSLQTAADNLKRAVKARAMETDCNKLAKPNKTTDEYILAPRLSTYMTYFH
jgi:hypothetical protein